MISFGLNVAHEDNDPVELLKHTKRAEDAGFEVAWSSDHFHPYYHESPFHRRASCGFAWAWLGAAGVQTGKIKLGTMVTSPLGRYHPAVVAQAFATLDYMFPGRIILGLGTGEAMNVRPLGHKWPSHLERREHLRECLEIIRRLWDEEFVDYDGKYFKLDTANLYTKPKGKIPIHVAAKGPKTAEIAGEFADSVDTVSDPKVLKDKILPSIRKGARKAGRDSETISLSTWISLSYDEDYELAHKSAMQAAPWVHPNIWNMDIWDPREIQKLGESLTREKVEAGIFIGAESEGIIKEVERLVGLGFSHVIISNRSPDKEKGIDFFWDEIFPHFRNSE